MNDCGPLVAHRLHRYTAPHVGRKRRTAEGRRLGRDLIERYRDAGLADQARGLLDSHSIWNGLGKHEERTP